jgi:hypothetical protein
MLQIATSNINVSLIAVEFLYFYFQPSSFSLSFFPSIPVRGRATVLHRLTFSGLNFNQAAQFSKYSFY